MQALMEAATVAGTSQRLSHADLAKCIWLLTFDDSGSNGAGVAAASANVSVAVSTTISTSPPALASSSSGAGGGASGGGVGISSQTQRLAKTFEERASRIHPDAFLPWIPSLVTCLLRPEGRFVSCALRSIALAYPNVLASVLRPLQHQLAVEVERDHRIAAILAELTPSQRQQLDESYTHCVDPTAIRRSSGGGCSSTHNPSAGSVLDTQGSSSASQHQSSLAAATAKKIKKRVVVVMRGAEGEKLCDANGGSHSSSNGGGTGSKDGQMTGELQDMEIDEEEGVGGVGSVEGGGANTPTPQAVGGGGEDDVEDSALLLPRTSYLSPAVGEALHRVNLLFVQLRQRHPARCYVMERFVENIGGRLLPGWAENLLHHLRTALSQLHEIAWAQVSRFVRRPTTCPSSTALRNLGTLPLPPWMATELRDIVACCGLPGSSASLTVALDDGDEPDGRTIFNPAFSDVAHLAYKTLSMEAEADPWFNPIKKRLTDSLEGIGSKTVLQVIDLLTKELIPLVQRRVANLPCTSYISDRGAGSLIEIITSASNQCAHGHHLRVSPTSTSTFPVPLELPGEALRMKTIPPLHQHQQFGGIGSSNGSGSGSGGASSSSSMHIHNLYSTETTSQQQPHVLYLADVLPCVVRSSGSGGRRLAMRANNGRLYHYDVGFLPRELPAGRAVSISSTDGTEASSLAPTLAAYAGWRESWSPPHLFQVLSDVAARSPETSKRRLGLVAPKYVCCYFKIALSCALASSI